MFGEGEPGQELDAVNDVEYADGAEVGETGAECLEWTSRPRRKLVFAIKGERSSDGCWAVHRVATADLGRTSISFGAFVSGFGELGVASRS